MRRLAYRNRIALLVTIGSCVCLVVVGVILYVVLRGDASSRPLSDEVLRTGSLVAGGERMTIEASSAELEHFEAAAKEQFGSYLWQLGVAVLVVWLPLSFLVGRFVAARAVRPVREVTQTAQQISLQSLDRRVDVEGPDDELHELAQTFDDMLERIQRSSDSQSRFMADVSHELRTPLAVVTTSLQLARRRTDPAGLDRALASGERAALRMGTLVDDLLALARWEEPGPLTELVDIDRVCADAVAELAPLAASVGCELIVDASTDAVVLGDSDALHRAIVNLADNAIDASRAGAPIRVEARLEARIVRIDVVDRGSGIDPAGARTLFERFRRAPADRSPRGSGTGLGLAIVRSIANGHGGSVRIERTSPSGTTMRIELPAAVRAGQGGRREVGAD